MFMTFEKRKKLQAVLEGAVCEPAPDNIQFDEEAQRTVYLLLLSLIYELNAKDLGTTPENEGEPCFCQKLHEILLNLSSLKVPETYGADYILKFKTLANNLENLSVQVNQLLTLLNCEFAERTLITVPDDATKQ